MELVDTKPLREKTQGMLTSESWYSYRRYFVDNFYLNSNFFLSQDKIIADLGGKKINKRGVFDIDKFSSHVKYFNLDSSTQPDFLCNLESLPVENEAFDCAILSEVLEHVGEPIQVLKEAHRILKKDGILLMTVPFQFQVHKDPTDYFRYTDMWLSENLTKLGFEIVKIESQGYFYSLTANLFKMYIHDILSRKTVPSFKIKLVRKFSPLLFKLLFQWSKKDRAAVNSLYIRTNTTGFGVIAKKIK